MTSNAALIDQINIVANRTWWGGSTHFLVMSDCESLCATCAKENYELIATAITDNDGTGGWLAIGVGTASELDDEDNRTCAHCYKFVDE